MAVSGKSPSQSSESAWVSFEGLAWAFRQYARTDLQLADKAVLLALASHIGNERYQCWPSRDRLVKMLGISLTSVKRALDNLQLAGLVQVAARTKPDGLSDTNIYTLILGGHGGPLGGHDAAGEGAMVAPEVDLDLEVKKKNTPTPDGVSSLLPGFTATPAPVKLPTADPIQTSNLRDFLGYFRQRYTETHAGNPYRLLPGEPKLVKDLLLVYQLEKLQEMADIMFSIEEYPFNLGHTIRKLSTYSNELAVEHTNRGAGRR